MIYTRPGLGLPGSENAEAKTIGHEAAYWWVYRRHGMKEAIRQELWRICWKVRRLDFAAIGAPLDRSAEWVAKRLADDGPLDFDAIGGIPAACNAEVEAKIFDRDKVVP